MSWDFCCCCWPDALLEPQDTEWSHKNVTLCCVEKISQVAQKVVSQTSFSCLKSQDLSANRGCARTDWAIYHLTELGFKRDLTVVADCKLKSESIVDKWPSSCSQLSFWCEMSNFREQWENMAGLACYSLRLSQEEPQTAQRWSCHG